MKTLLICVVFLASLISCTSPTETSDEIIEEAIKYHGGQSYDTLEVTFDFRDKTYVLIHNNGLFKYKRIFTDSAGNNIVDILNNEGFTRKINDTTAELSDKDSTAYANSVNSVHYFALLPYGLDNEAVISERLINTPIKGKEYYSIQVSFQQEGGGTDFQDVFLYWFDQDDYSMDYLAYSYHTEGGGLRFREAYNPRRIQGVIFQDYNNFKAGKEVQLEALPSLFEEQELNLLSKIELVFPDTIK